MQPDYNYRCDTCSHEYYSYPAGPTTCVDCKRRFEEIIRRLNPCSRTYYPPGAGQDAFYVTTG